MLYLVTLASKNGLGKLDVAQLTGLKKGIQAAMTKGSIKGAYAKVGGGLVLVVDSPSNGQLTVDLREHQITDAEVVPLVDFINLLDGHIEFKNTGKVSV
jgi:hypothetical protein